MLWLKRNWSCAMLLSLVFLSRSSTLLEGSRHWMRKQEKRNEWHPEENTMKQMNKKLKKNVGVRQGVKNSKPFIWSKLMSERSFPTKSFFNKFFNSQIEKRIFFWLFSVFSRNFRIVAEESQSKFAIFFL